MKYLSKPIYVSLPCRLAPASPGILTKRPSRSIAAHFSRQRGVILFLTLLALLAMSLAAVALIRSVDTSTLIAGNLAFKQSTTTSGDGGIEDAITWLVNTDIANGTTNIYKDSAHTLNVTNAAVGYYSYLERDASGLEKKSLTDPNATDHFKWDGSDSSAEVIDSGGNRKRYIIQRMCRTFDTKVEDNECLFGGAPIPDKNDQATKMTSDVCFGPGCPLLLGEVPQYRITVKIIGPKYTVSYVQAFAY
jgi:type IV pilus assembly protein PilX